jgi:spermidine synthase
MISKEDDLIIHDDKILTNGGHEVMMDWEIPIMKLMSKEVCKFGGDILEVGFGMGISANEIQKHQIKSHTIIEINSGIYDKAKEWSLDKENVNIINDDFLNYLKYTTDKFDGIFFDPYPSEILGVGDDNFLYGKLFFDGIKKLCKENCRVVPFLTGCGKNLDYLIEYVPLKSIESYLVDLENSVKTQYFSGDKASVFVFNI